MKFEGESETLADLRQRKITARVAIARLVAGGINQISAETRIFIALGGDDILAIDTEGRKCYRRSGVTIEEMKRRMAE